MAAWLLERASIKQNECGLLKSKEQKIQNQLFGKRLPLQKVKITQHRLIPTDQTKLLPSHIMAEGLKALRKVYMKPNN